MYSVRVSFALSDRCSPNGLSSGMIPSDPVRAGSVTLSPEIKKKKEKGVEQAHGCVRS